MLRRIELFVNHHNYICIYDDDGLVLARLANQEWTLEDQPPETPYKEDLKIIENFLIHGDEAKDERVKIHARGGL